jgi:glycosyltransferase involved in cell wall biosynthesis
MHSVSAIIPVYRSQQTLAELCRQLLETLETTTLKFEIIFVEDCGGDHSWRIIKQLTRLNPNVRGIRLNRNYGQHNALLCGIRAARNDIIITMDDDLQHPANQIPLLLAALDEGHDVVYGAPQAERHGWARNLASQATKIALAGAMGAETARNVSAFRAFRTRLREGFQNYHGPFVSIDVLLTWTTSRFCAIKVRHLPRAAGASGYTVGLLVRHAVNLMTGFSALPLQIASMTGFAFVVFGGLVVAWILLNFILHGRAVPGFAFLASIVTVFSGAQLFALGIFGEYLARIHFRIMDRPTYLIRDSTDDVYRNVASAAQMGSEDNHVLL